MKFIAKFLSYLFHPVLIPLITTGCYFLLTDNFQQEIIIKYTFLQIIVMTFLLPVFLFLILRSFRVLNSSLMINKLEERKIPIFFNILLVSIMIFRFWEHEGNQDLKTYFKGYLLTYILLLIAVFLNKKISIHVSSFATILPFTAFISIHFYEPLIGPFCIGIIVLGALTSARLYLKAHTNSEVILGFLIGIIPQILFYSI